MYVVRTTNTWVTTREENSQGPNITFTFRMT